VKKVGKVKSKNKKGTKTEVKKEEMEYE